MTPHQAQQVYQEFGLEAWDVVSQDPYRLAERVRGFGFKTCDRIGAAWASPSRPPSGSRPVSSICWARPWTRGTCGAPSTRQWPRRRNCWAFRRS
jgi:hypothetical protein